MPGIPGRLHHRPGLRREALSESGAGAALRERCVSADTYGAGAGESERVMRCEAAAKLPGGSPGRGCGRAVEVRVGKVRNKMDIQGTSNGEVEASL